MIKINIYSNGKQILDSLETDKTTLSENALIIRRLEELKQKLLSMEYKNNLEIKK